MGTETKNRRFLHSFVLVLFVKLNNPQMGTETSLCLIRICYSFTVFVKLNNPQMRTETRCMKTTIKLNKTKELN